MSNIGYVARNFFALGSGEMVSRILAFCVTIYLARRLGADGYGVIAFAAGVTLYLSKMADFAIEAIGTKEIAHAPGSSRHLASAVISVRLALAALLTAAAILGAQLLLVEPERAIASLYFFTLVPLAANTKWIHLGQENTRPIGLARIAGEILALGLILGFVQSKNELWVAPVARVVCEVFVAFLLFQTLGKGNKFGLRWDLDTALPIFTKALPLLGQNLLWLVVYNSDLIFLRLFHDLESVGYYAAAYALITFLANVGFAYGMSLLPTLTRLGAGSAREKALYQTALGHIYVVCMPVTIGGCLLASQIIGLGFGKGYENSISALQVLIWCIPLSLLRLAPWAALIARGQQRLLLKVAIYAVLVNVAGNSLLIPSYGILGAATATVATESLTGIILFKYAACQKLPFVSFRRLRGPTVACIFMTLTLVVFRHQNILVDIVLGIVIYALVLTLLGGIRFQRGHLPFLKI